MTGRAARVALWLVPAVLVVVALVIIVIPELSRPTYGFLGPTTPLAILRSYLFSLAAPLFFAGLLGFLVAIITHALRWERRQTPF